MLVQRIPHPCMYEIYTEEQAEPIENYISDNSLTSYTLLSIKSLVEIAFLEELVTRYGPNSLELHNAASIIENRCIMLKELSRSSNLSLQELVVSSYFNDDWISPDGHPDGVQANALEEGILWINYDPIFIQQKIYEYIKKYDSLSCFWNDDIDVVQILIDSFTVITLITVFEY